MESYLLDFLKSYILHSICFLLAKSFASRCNSKGGWGFLGENGQFAKIWPKDLIFLKSQLSALFGWKPHSNHQPERLCPKHNSSSCQDRPPQSPHSRTREAIFETLWQVRRKVSFPNWDALFHEADSHFTGAGWHGVWICITDSKWPQMEWSCFTLCLSQHH